MIRLILLTDFTEAFAHNLLRGILEYSKTTEPWVVCRMPPSYKHQFGIPGVLKWAKRWNADAIIAQFDEEDEVEVFRKHGIVAVAQDFKTRFSTIPNITGDYRLTGEMAADYFLRRGYRNFAYFGYKEAFWSQERCVGFRERVERSGVGARFYEYQNQELDSLWHYEQQPIIDWIRSLPYQTALMACDDTQANKVMEVCRVLGIQIPRQIAVLGVDNDEIICNLSEPSLSSVGLDIVKGGFESARMIEQLVRDKKALYEDVVIYPTNIYSRLSTDLFSSEDPNILAALKYIQQNLSHTITVDDVLKRVPMSRRLLEIRFKQVTGLPVYQYIMEARMELFARLLLEDSRPIADLAISVGLTDFRNLARQFRLREGCSPSEYRKRFRVI